MFERDQTVYRMDFEMCRGQHQLVLEPYAPNQVVLNARVEVEKPRYFYAVNDAHRKPKGSPTLRLERLEVKGSRRVVPVSGLACTLVRALYKNEIVGESAAAAMHALFWQYFVEDDEGLKYLYRFGAEDTGEAHARMRVSSLAGRDGADEAVKAIDAARIPSEAKDLVAKYKSVTWLVRLHACQQALVDRDFHDAVCALAAAPESALWVLEFLRVQLTLNGKRAT
jgi:hypothetical protein